ncbi:MAG TPA: UbiA family prenyltransferase [Niabella sp.]|nr:UbiA family prenyltransferase [Niabella sp.]HQW14885.1 UbiA family prenyltransferase [Niabella sp.]HQX18490.1 UbiA family prenyltransferase [Niabella sp.]HQX41488.1 UbiA family prenyltransferase [Niabella sp.]HRB06017.1 UbiA family prenyltransferase [Niabella sp.]
MSSTHNRKFFDFIIFSNLFIAFCAVVMAGYTTHLFSIGFPPSHFGWFLFFSTLASYSIHWYLTDEKTEITDSRTFWLGRNKPVHLFFFVSSAIGSGIFLLQELGYIKWIIPAIFLTIMYTAPKFPFKPFFVLRKVIYAKTILLAVMWTYITSILPLLVTTKEWEVGFTLFAINRFTLIFPICILFDLRDRDYDKAGGVKSLVTILSPLQIKYLFDFLISVNVVSAILMLNFENLKIIDLLILLVPTLLTFALYHRAVKTKNDYLFYFILDGLMALSPLLYFAKLIYENTIAAVG